MKNIRSAAIDAMCNLLLERESMCCADILGILSEEECRCDCSMFRSQGVTIEMITEGSWYVHLPRASSIYVAMCPVDIELHTISGDVVEITLDNNLKEVQIMEKFVPFAIHANRDSTVLIKSLT